MNLRDKAIIADLEKFKVLDRDQMIKLHFLKNKDSIQSCNKVMKRLARDGLVSVDHSARPYNYFPVPSIKKDSTKIPHYKEIADFYLSLYAYEKPTEFEVEYRVGDKGKIEPDVYCRWMGTSFFVEIQRNVYTKSVMNAKMNRYLDYFNEGEWRDSFKFFPHIWLITQHNYKLDEFDTLRIHQTKNVCDFVESLRRKT